MKYPCSQNNNYPPPCAGPPKTINKYNNDEKINIIFEEMNNKINEVPTQTVLQFPLNGTIFDLIEQYKNKINDHSTDKLFIFNNMKLCSFLTAYEANLYNNCKITVFNC